MANLTIKSEDGKYEVNYVVDETTGNLVDEFEMFDDEVSLDWDDYERCRW